MEVKKIEPITEAEAKSILAKRVAGSELPYEQAQAVEHAEKFANMPPAKAKKLVEEIRKNEKIPLETAVKIVDVMPEHPSTLRAILIKDKVELNDEEIEEIMKIIKK